MRVPHCLATLAVVALVSCDEPAPSDPLEAVPAALMVVGGDAQTGAAGAPLADPITVRVANADGRPVKGTEVRFAVVSGGGEIVVETAASDYQGLARARWTLGTVAADSQVVEASLASFPALAAVRLRATARAAEPATLQPASADTSAGRVGTALVDSLAVTIKDRFGNPVPGLEVAWEVVADGGTLSPARTATNAAGVAKAQWTLGMRVDSVQTALARVAGLTPVAFTASATTAGVTLQLVKRSGDGQRGPVDRVLADSVGVLLRMPDGRPVRGATVMWGAEAGSGSVSPLASRTDENGAAAAVWRLGTVLGLAHATATVDGGTLVFTSLAEADVPASIVRVSGGGVGPVGGALADSLAVRVTDRLDNPVPNAEVAWSASVDGSVHPERSRTGADGVARAQWTLGPVVDSAQQARAVVAGLPPVGFTASAATAGVTLQLVKRSGDGQRGPVDRVLADSVGVLLRMPDGRPVRGATVMWGAEAGSGSVSPLASRTDENGAAAAVWRLGTVLGLAHATATVDGGTLVFTSLAEADVPASIVRVSGGGVGPVGGALADSLAVRVTDRLGNPVPNAEVSWSASAGGSVHPERSRTGADGVARAQWTLGLVVDSAQQAQAVATGLPPVGFTASAATAGVTLQLAKRSGDGQRGPVDRVLADSVGVLLRMPDGRPVRGATVTWGAEAGSGSVSPLASRTDENGAAAAVWRLGTAPGLAHATATVDAGTLVFTSLAEADVPASIVRVAGGGVGPVGGTLADSLAVRVTDRLGNPVPNAEVAWSASADGSVRPERSRTSADGIARTQWTLGLVVDSAQQAQAVAAGLPPVGFGAMATTQGVPLQLARIAGNGQVADAGTQLPDSLEVQLRTSAGSPVRGATVRWSVPPGSGTVSSASVLTNAQGRSRAAWTLGTAAGALQAFAAVDSGTIPFAATARAGAPSVVRIDGGNGQAGTRYTVLPDSLVAWVTDRYANGIPGVLVHWSVDPGDDGMVEADSVRTDATGRARVRWAMGAVPGTIGRAVAQVDGLTSAAFSATVQPGELHLRKISPTTLLQPAGGGNTYGYFADTLKVAVSDDQGRPAVGVQVQFDGSARTAWNGTARYFYNFTYSTVTPAPPPTAPTAEFESEVVTFPVPDVTVPGYTASLVIVNWRDSFTETDTVLITATTSEKWGRPVPPRQWIDLKDDRGWSIGFASGDTIAYPVGAGAGQRSFTACAPGWQEWDEGCSFGWIMVAEREPAAVRARAH